MAYVFSPHFTYIWFYWGYFFFLPYKCLNILSFYIYPSFFFFFSFLFSLSMAVIYILFLCLSKTYLTLKSLFVKTIFVFFSLSTFWTNIASWANHRSASERGEERQNRKKKTMAVVYATPRQLGTDDLTGKTLYTHTHAYTYTLFWLIWKYVADIMTHLSQIFQQISWKNRANLLHNYDMMVTFKKFNIDDNNI